MRIRIFSVVLLFALILAGCSSKDTPAANTSWLLDSLTVQGTSIDLSPAQPITLEIGSGTEVGGSSGCNSYFGDLKFKTDGVVEAGNFGGTEMACETGMDVEAAFLGAMSRLDTLVEFTQYEMTLSADNGETQLVFQLLRTME